MDNPADASPSARDRLDSWKEIALYLKRDARTLQRWEKEEGLPVHRLQHGKQGSIYAYRQEIDDWWESRRRDLERRAAAVAVPRWIAAVVVVGLAVALAAIWLVALRRPSSSDRADAAAPFFQFPIVLADDGVGSGLSMSPDGRQVAFNTCCTDRRIWRHSFITGTTSPVPGSESGTESFWSPDSSRLAFFAAGKVKVIDGDGAPVTIADAPGGSVAGSWSANGTLLFSAGSRLFRVAAAGGPATAIAVSDPGGANAIRKAPRILPDGRHFIYHLADVGHGGIYRASLDAPAATFVVDSEYPAAFVKPSHLLYVRGTALVAHRLNVDTGALEGEATPVANDVAPGALSVPARFAAADSGALAFVATRGGRRARLKWFDRLGTVGASLPEVGDAEFLNPAISPDGDRVAVNRMDPQTGNWDIWIVDVGRDLSSRATFDAAQDADPVWSPDGTAMVFASTRGGRLALYRKSIASVQPEEELLRLDRAVMLIPSDWSRDGRFIVYSATMRGLGTAIWALPTSGDKTPVPVQGLAAAAYGGRVSPDGRWIAYSSFDTGANEVYVQRFMGGGAKTQISSGGGAHPRWSADGRELVYWATPRGLAAATLALTENHVRVTATRTLIASPIPNLIDARTQYDLARDGRMLLRQPIGSEPATITVLSNWREKPKR